VPRKLEVLAEHCDALGRDRSEITVSVQANACVAPTHDQAVAEADRFLSDRGIDLATLGTEEAEMIRSMIVMGDPDEVSQIFAERRIDGIDGFTVNAPANCHIEGRVALLGNALARAVNG
jgi:alkanesulfonate monooxygenase SsuD/methylene tetrahydromethanopterin reductase-like flavin-dependent oxidoreductase (luciferase family)